VSRHRLRVEPQLREEGLGCGKQYYWGDAGGGGDEAADLEGRHGDAHLLELEGSIPVLCPRTFLDSLP
jgi:hypothetical protein